MDLRRVKDEDRLFLCKRYFQIGFALLPFLWAVNSVWFFKDAFLRTTFDGQKSIRKYVIGSIIGSVIWIVGIATWAAIYQQNRADWGATGDYISFIIPKGIA